MVKKKVEIPVLGKSQDSEGKFFDMSRICRTISRHIQGAGFTGDIDRSIPTVFESKERTKRKRRRRRALVLLVVGQVKKGVTTGARAHQVEVRVGTLGTDSDGDERLKRENLPSDLKLVVGGRKMVGRQDATGWNRILGCMGWGQASRTWIWG